MSMTALADAAIRRNQSIAPHLVQTFAAAPSTTAASANTGVTKGLSSLANFFPAEILTAYIGAVGLVHASGTEMQWVVFGVFLTLTPILEWGIYATKAQKLGQPLPYNPSRWPKAALITSFAAFAIYAFSFPNSPFNQFGWYTSVLAGLVVLVSSTLVTVFGPLFRFLGD
jgi:hypothetical protein